MPRPFFGLLTIQGVNFYNDGRLPVLNVDVAVMISHRNHVHFFTLRNDNENEFHLIV